MNNKLSLIGGDTSEGWGIVDNYNADEIEKIDDGQEGNTLNQPTSIPSPYARIDLVLTAFKNLNLGRQYLNNQKLVSKVLDMGELLFNYEMVKGKLDITKWVIRDKNGPVALRRLKESRMTGHNKLGRVLDMFLEQDKKPYNFGNLDYIHIISYGGLVIGGTSPVTIFFTTPNEHYFNEIDIKFGSHRLFTKEKPYIPLYARDIEYQKMWYFLLQKHYAEFYSNFKAVAEYIERSIRDLKEKSRRDYDMLFDERGNLKIDDSYEKNFLSPLDTGKENDNVDILGLPFYKRNSRQSLGAIERQSQFAIESNRYTAGPMPLVLQTSFSKPLQYTDNTKWVSGTPVPLYAKESWKQNERQLPGLNQNYPWLTVNDLLEPYLVKLNFPVNKDRFYLGREEGIGPEEAYLPPLKKDFFEFFSVSELERGIVEYKISKKPAGEMLVRLGVPINGGNDRIIFEKTYSPIPIGINNINLTDETRTDGKNVGNTAYIVDVPFNVAIYPPIKGRAINPNYSVQLVREPENRLVDDISIDFHNEITKKDAETKLTEKKEKFKYRAGRDSGFFPTKYYKVIEEFDIIFLTMQSSKADINAVILPKFIQYVKGSDKYSVAFDFGTTNSHIEISVNGGPPQPFQVNVSQVSSLSVLSTKTYPVELYLSALYEFIPETIGNPRGYSFPIRTAISEVSNVDHKLQDLSLFSDFSIPFYFEKEIKRKIDHLHTNLKWARLGSDSLNHTKFFLEELVLLVRNKILMEGGDLQATKIVWTFPSSMKRAQQAQLGTIWREIVEKYFGKSLVEPSSGQLVSVMESLAPFYHYQQIYPRLMSGVQPVLSIDIGGGTTDTVIHYKNGPIALTSFRFAGNAVFGDGFLSEAAGNNGFIVRYKELFRELLKRNEIGSLQGYNEDVIATNISENIVSFWFSIEKHADVNDKTLFSFNKRLADDPTMKIVFVLFYTAIVYHIVKLMKERQEPLPMPGGFIFSGTGSKMLQILSPEPGLLADYTKLIIEKIYGRKYEANERLNVFYDTTAPKEATCKGALRMTDKDYHNRPEAVVYSGRRDKPFEAITYEQAKSYDLIQEMVNEVEEFFKFFFDLNRDFSFEDEFGVSPLAIRIAKENLPFQLKDYMAKAISLKSEGLDDLDRNLEDTLFFYPIVGAINNLAFELSQRAGTTL